MFEEKIMQPTDLRSQHGLWTKKEAAAYYRVSARTIDRWLSEQVIPTHARVEVGGVVRFRPDVLIASVESGGAADA